MPKATSTPGSALQHCERSHGALLPAYPPPAEVRERLLEMAFPECAACVARLLTQLGYRNVRQMGPLYQRGRNMHGGMDLSAEQGQGLTMSKVIVQVKQYREAVPRAYVDELRGAMLRVGADQGMLITTSEFAPAAVMAALAAQHAAKVRLVDGAELVRLMAEHRTDLSGRAWSGFLPPAHAGTGGMEHGSLARSGTAADRSGGRPPTGAPQAPSPLPAAPEYRGVTVTVTVRPPDQGTAHASAPLPARR